MAYKKSLLSSLILIRYEDTIDSMNDLENSRLPLMVWKGSTFHGRISGDSSPIMRSIFNRSITVSLDAGGMPKWILEM